MNNQGLRPFLVGGVMLVLEALGKVAPMERIEDLCSHWFIEGELDLEDLRM